jgi:hypothetical protein
MIRRDVDHGIIDMYMYQPTEQRLLSPPSLLFPSSSILQYPTDGATVLGTIRANTHLYISLTIIAISFSRLLAKYRLVAAG